MTKSSKNKIKKRHKSQKWTVTLLVVVAVAALAFAFYMSRDLIFSPDSFENEEKYARRSSEYENLQGEISRFFTAIHDAAWARDRKKKWILDIDLSERSLLDILDEKSRLEGSPVTLDWRGPIKTRWFMAEDTLKSSAERIAAEDGMELIWWLEKDYVVRAAFQVHSDILNTLDRLARSLNSQHPGNVQAFLCPRQRVILIAGSGAAESVIHYCSSIEDIRLQARQAN